MILQIDHATGTNLNRNRKRLAAYRSQLLAPHVAGQGWMGSAPDLSSRFRLLSFAEKSEAEAAAHNWEPPAVETVIRASVAQVRRHIPLADLHLTLVPALPFHWFREYGLPGEPDLQPDTGALHAARVAPDGGARRIFLPPPVPGRAGVVARLPSRGIPTFAGYTSGYRAVARQVVRNPQLSLRQLFWVDPRHLVES